MKRLISISCANRWIHNGVGSVFFCSPFNIASFSHLSVTLSVSSVEWFILALSLTSNQVAQVTAAWRLLRLAGFLTFSKHATYVCVLYVRSEWCSRTSAHFLSRINKISFRGSRNLYLRQIDTDKEKAQRGELLKRCKHGSRQKLTISLSPE